MCIYAVRHFLVFAGRTYATTGKAASTDGTMNFLERCIGNLYPANHPTTSIKYSFTFLIRGI